MDKIKKFILLVALLVSCLILSDINSKFIITSLIPLTYGLTFYYIIPNKTVIGTGFTMMSIVMSLRYIIYPLLLPYENIKSPMLELLNLAVILSIIEIIIIHSTIYLYYRNKYIENELDLVVDKVNYTIPSLLLVFVLGVIIVYPTAFSNTHFILSANNINEDIVKIPGVISQLLSWGRIYLIIFFFSLFYRRYQYFDSKFYFCLSILVILYPALFFKGHSRLSLLMPLICSMFMLLKIYKEKAKKIVVLIGLYGFFAILILSLLKFYGEATSNSAGNFTLKENSSLINAYFGGLKNVIVGLKAYINNGFSLSVFINDIFRNAMGVSQFFLDNLNNSVSIFNLQYYGSRIADDQICPTIIEGLLSFGPILFFIPTYIMVTTVCWMDYKWHTTTSLEFSYLLAYMGTLIGWCVPGNMMHLSSSIFNIYIPMCILFIVNRRFKI